MNILYSLTHIHCMVKKGVSTLLLACMVVTAYSQSWLPQQWDPQVTMRLLQCTYDKARLTSCQPILGNGSDRWKVTSVDLGPAQGVQYVFEALRDMDNAGVAVAFDQYDWCSDNYVMIPAVVYNGNRERIVNRQYATGLDATDYYRKDLALTSNPIPQLSPDFGAPSRLEVSVCNAATPVITYYDRKKGKGTFLFTDQGISWDGGMKDHALIVEESRDRSVASFVISAPGVREKKPEFIGFSESPDRGLSVKKGDKVIIRVCKVDFQAKDIPAFLGRFMKERKLHVLAETPRNLIPMSKVSQMMVKDIDERYYQGEKGSFYCPENANWMSYGWIGGMMNTYPMLALGDKDHLQKVKNTFDFGLLNGYGESGYYFDVLGADGKVLHRDAADQHPEIGLTRKNADLLYWMTKQLMLLDKQGHHAEISLKWESQMKNLANAFVKTWRENGTWGNYLNIHDGRIAVWNTTGGVMAVAGLVLAAQYFHQPEYLAVAREAARYYYDQFSLRGFTSGACGDILQNADSETSIALATAMITMYEATGEPEFLKAAEAAACLCATWVVSFPYQLPMDTPLGKLGTNFTGAVWASTQNKHGAPGFCTQSGDVLFKLYRATGNRLYADLLRDVIHAHAEGIQPNGKITERLTYCDADSRGSRLDGGKTGWTETNGALMSIEIPGIYVRMDHQDVYVFDHVNLIGKKKSKGGLSLTLQNPTPYDAVVTIFAENGAQAARPLGDNAFLNWHQKVKVKAGTTRTVLVKDLGTK